ncbi:hypothetical protein RhiirC2_868869 [Rhizophagus irregularis]|uniref:Uncharacterized protein n=1 Tax=Rhizophagus irregularis TaxID=588596 RepID=A0A2N1MUH3_9GLOM|nr:hypothetical protein RhiirC2_868869 [Rhizophagus irregularis]
MILVFLIIVVEDFNNSNDQRINKTSRINSIFKGGSKRLSKVFKMLQISSKNDIQNDHKKEKMQQMKGSVNDDDEIHNNPNLHSEDQDEFEIPDGTQEERNELDNLNNNFSERLENLKNISSLHDEKKKKQSKPKTRLT